MDFFELFRSGNLLWGVFLVIAVGFLLSSVGRYRRSGSKADLPRVLTDTLATAMVTGAVLHMGIGLPHPTPLLVVYGLVLAGLFFYRMRVVSELQTETEAKSEALAEANRARKAAGTTTPEPSPQQADEAESAPQTTEGDHR